MAASGDNHLGGQDFNLILLEHLVTTIAAKLSSSSGASVAGMTLSIKDNGEAMRALREEVERVKIDLNDEADCSGAFVEFSGAGAQKPGSTPPRTPSVQITPCCE